MHEAARIGFYGLLAAASPVTLLATLVVLAGERGRANGVAFAAAFVAGQSIAFLVAFSVGAQLTESAQHTATAYIELAVGVVLLVTAFRQRPPHEPRPEGRAPRTKALFANLARVTPRISLGIGLPLGIGAKRLIITIVAAATVALAGRAPAEDVALGVLYVALAALTVWAPVAVYLLLGTRADRIVARSRSWITAHERPLTFTSALVLGGLFVLDALYRLAA
jgi:Sap-like sulfolipid-1-addressing protein